MATNGTPGYETISKAIEHLRSMCSSEDVAIIVKDATPLADDALFIRFEFDGEKQGAIYYPSDDVLFAPADWQGVVADLGNIAELDWLTPAGDQGIIVSGLPRLFASYRDDARKEYGRKVEARRRELGMTTTELARRSGLGQSHISRIENGRYNVTIDTMTRINAALGM